MDCVESSSLAAIGYDEPRRILAVMFHGGAIFHYAGVPKRHVEQLIGAESIGRYFHEHIRGRFQAEKMTGPCPNCGDCGWIGDRCQDCGTASYQREPYVPRQRRSDEH